MFNLDPASPRTYIAQDLGLNKNRYRTTRPAVDNPRYATSPPDFEIDLWV